MADGGVQQVWARQIERASGLGGDHDHDDPRVMALDEEGAAYVAMRGAWGDRGLGVMKVDRFGREQWRVFLAHQYDEPRFAAIDPGGLLYIVGSAYSGQIDGRSKVHRDYLVAGIHPASGRVVWRDTLDVAGEDDMPRAATLTHEGDLVISGWSQRRTETAWDAFTVRFDEGGRQRWRAFYDASDPGAVYGSNEEPEAIVAEDDGTILVGGTSGGSILVLAYDPDGTLRWTITHRPTFARSVQEPLMSGHPEGGVVLAARAWVGEWSNDADVVTARIDAEGDLLWSARWFGTEKGDNRPLALEVDSEGNTYLLVQRADTVSSARVLLKYDASGSVAWERRFETAAHRDSSGLLWDFPVVLTLDDAGAAYLAGTSAGEDSFSGPPLRTWKIDPSGATRWQVEYVPSGYYYEQNRVVTVEVTPRGDVYLLAAGSAVSAPYYSYTRPLLIRYAQGDVEEETPPPVPAPSIETYPLPASQELTVRYALPRPAFVRLTLYDALGREVSLREEADRAAGVHVMKLDVSGLPAGVYAYRLAAGSTGYRGTFVIAR